MLTQHPFPLYSPEVPSRLHFCDLLLVPGVFPSEGARTARTAWGQGSSQMETSQVLPL